MFEVTRYIHKHDMNKNFKSYEAYLIDADYELIFNTSEFARISPLCSHSKQRSRSSRLLSLEQEMNVDRDHRVLSIHCCDSKCSVAFQQTRHRHGEMQFIYGLMMTK